MPPAEPDGYTRYNPHRPKPPNRHPPDVPCPMPPLPTVPIPPLPAVPIPPLPAVPIPPLPAVFRVLPAKTPASPGPSPATTAKEDSRCGRRVRTARRRSSAARLVSAPASVSRRPLKGPAARRDRTLPMITDARTPAISISHNIYHKAMTTPRPLSSIPPDFFREEKSSPPDPVALPQTRLLLCEMLTREPDGYAVCSRHQTTRPHHPILTNEPDDNASKNHPARIARHRPMPPAEPDGYARYNPHRPKPPNRHPPDAPAARRFSRSNRETPRLRRAPPPPPPIHRLRAAAGVFHPTAPSAFSTASFNARLSKPSTLKGSGGPRGWTLPI